MNREIKFRAWDTELKFMVDPTAYILSFAGIPFFDNRGDIIEQTEKLVLMQYTGLKDSVGNEIYEGDIIRILSSGDEREIIYHKCAFGVQINEALFAPIYWHEDILIIGNRYENPELLPKTN